MSNELARYDQIKNVMRAPEVTALFAQFVGDQSARAYIGSVMTAVAVSTALQACETKSILYAALRAASLHLSVDPSTKQAHLVPYKGKAVLVIGYKGYHDMALRTHQYEYIQVGDICEGMVVEEDIITGFHSIHGSRTSNKIIGHILSFKLRDGYRKTFYMTVEQIHEHAAKYSRSYSEAVSPWKTHTYDMQRKTVLRLGLSKWGIFDAHDLMMMNAEEIEPDEENIVDVAALENKPPEQLNIPQAQALRELGFEPEPVKPLPVQPEPAAEPEPEALDGEQVMSFENAAKVTNSKGVLYTELEDVVLRSMRKVLREKLAAGDATNRNDYQFKVSAINAILAERAKPK